MSSISQIMDQIVAERTGEFNGIVGTVLSVDPTAKTCEVKDLRDAIYSNVRLIAANTTGLYMVPKIGSYVIIHQISDQDYFVSMFSQLDTITMLDGSFGGLTKTQELKTQLDKLNAQLQAIITALAWAPVAGDGGAALKAAFTASIAGKPAGTFTGIENTTISHGV